MKTMSRKDRVPQLGTATAQVSPTRRQVVHGIPFGAGALALGLVRPVRAWAAGGDLTVAIPNNPTTIDPIAQANHDAMVVTQAIFENLLEVDHDGNLQPQLAISLPKVSSDKLDYVFDLRPGVTFQNGESFGAEDVKYSFDYVLNPENKALRRPLFNRITEVTVENQL